MLLLKSVLMLFILQKAKIFAAVWGVNVESTGNYLTRVLVVSFILVRLCLYKAFTNRWVLRFLTIILMKEQNSSELWICFSLLVSVVSGRGSGPRGCGQTNRQSTVVYAADREATEWICHCGWVLKKNMTVILNKKCTTQEIHWTAPMEFNRRYIVGLHEEFPDVIVLFWEWGKKAIKLGRFSECINTSPV